MFNIMMNRISVPVQPVVKSAPAKLDAGYSTHLEYGPESIESEALVVVGPREPFTMMSITLDEVRSDEYPIEMEYSGLCHTVRASQVHLYILGYGVKCASPLSSSKAFCR